MPISESRIINSIPMRKKLFYFSLIITGLFFVGGFIFAQSEVGVVITPTVVDEQAKASEIIKRSVVIKNNTNQKVTIYPMVNDLSEIDGKQAFPDPSQLDKKTSLARWIRFKRSALEIMPGEEVVRGLEIRINMLAVPGKRHAVISFPEGNNTTIAADNLEKKNFPRLFINVEIVEDIVEKAILNDFKVVRNMYFKPPVEFSFSIGNSGNKEINPSGAILIFNRRGQEVGTVEVNSDGGKIAADGGQEEYSLKWDSPEGLGRYKAKLELEYGQKDKRDLQDVIYFWYLPLSFLIVFIGGLFITMFILTLFIFKKTYNARHPHPHHVAQTPERSDGVLDLSKK